MVVKTGIGVMTAVILVRVDAMLLLAAKQRGSVSMAAMKDIMEVAVKTNVAHNVRQNHKRYGNVTKQMAGVILDAKWVGLVLTALLNASIVSNQFAFNKMARVYSAVLMALLEKIASRALM